MLPETALFRSLFVVPLRALSVKLMRFTHSARILLHRQLSVRFVCLFVSPCLFTKVLVKIQPSKTADIIMRTCPNTPASNDQLLACLRAHSAALRCVAWLACWLVRAKQSCSHRLPRRPVPACFFACLLLCTFADCRVSLTCGCGVQRAWLAASKVSQASRALPPARESALEWRKHS